MGGFLKMYSHEIEYKLHGEDMTIPILVKKA